MPIKAVNLPPLLIAAFATERPELLNRYLFEMTKRTRGEGSSPTLEEQGQMVEAIGLLATNLWQTRLALKATQRVLHDGLLAALKGAVKQVDLCLDIAREGDNDPSAPRTNIDDLIVYFRTRQVDEAE